MVDPSLIQGYKLLGKYLSIHLKNDKLSLDMFYLCHLEVIMMSWTHSGLISCSVGMLHDSSIFHDHIVALICAINRQKVIKNTQSEVRMCRIHVQRKLQTQEQYQHSLHAECAFHMSGIKF